MNRKRFAERVADYRKALSRLKDALAQPENDYIRDSIIQRFEFTYELAWKAMKLWLEFKEIDARNAKDVLREALQQGLIDDGNAWSKLHDMRNKTSHIYDEKLAKEIVQTVRSQGVEVFAALENKFHSSEDLV